MEKAKAAVGNFLSKDGKHDTTVHESVNSAVTNENVSRTQHENVQTAVDREVHQDHHHTSVQPIQQKEILPEQHSHNLAGVEHRNIRHGNDDHVKQRLANEQAQFKNTRTVGETQQTSSNAAVGGEHVHHHVHENIQPVIQKETVQPSVVHTTVPVHEIHQNEAKHHTATQLPSVTMDEFQRQGGHLSGRQERTDAFSGEPKSVGGSIGGAGARGTTSVTDADTSNGSYARGSNSGTTGANTTGTTGTTGTSASHATGSTAGNSTTKGKPSLMDRLNPKVDADGDGKAGIMK